VATCFAAAMTAAGAFGSTPTSGCNVKRRCTVEEAYLQRQAHSRRHLTTGSYLIEDAVQSGAILGLQRAVRNTNRGDARKYQSCGA